VQPKTRAICEEEDLNDGSVYRRKHLTQWHNTSRPLEERDKRMERIGNLEGPARGVRSESGPKARGYAAGWNYS
jgi:hypothetical protein